MAPLAPERPVDTPRHLAARRELDSIIGFDDDLEVVRYVALTLDDR